MLIYDPTVTIENDRHRLRIIGAGPVVPLRIGGDLAIQESIAGESAGELIVGVESQPEALIGVRRLGAEHNVGPINFGAPHPGCHSKGMIRQRDCFSQPENIILAVKDQAVGIPAFVSGLRAGRIVVADGIVEHAGTIGEGVGAGALLKTQQSHGRLALDNATLQFQNLWV